MSKILITGITSQDGSYLAEFLLSKGYEIHRMVRWVVLENSEHRLWRIRPILDKEIFYPCSLYEISKVVGFYLVQNHREAYKIFTCNGILFNHGSPL